MPNHRHRPLMRRLAARSIASVIDTMAIARMNASMQNSPGQL
jgi:hypothetical protein